METYSVKELDEKLSDYVLELGIDPNFLKNPAFVSVITEIDNLIYGNFDDKIEVVKKENGNISFVCNSTNGKKYSTTISSDNPKTIRCINLREEESYLGKNSPYYIQAKDATEEVATIDKSGFLDLDFNVCHIDNVNCKNGECNYSYRTEHRYYQDNGLMRDKEVKTFVPEGAHSRLHIYIDRFSQSDLKSMLSLPSWGISNRDCTTRTLLTREKFDIARYRYEDKGRGVEYSATVPLSTEHGIREMEVSNGILHFPSNIVIPPLSQEEIDKIIQKETNPKVVDALRKSSIGRDTYAYNSAEDKNFICEGISIYHGKSK